MSQTNDVPIISDEYESVGWSEQELVLSIESLMSQTTAFVTPCWRLVGWHALSMLGHGEITEIS